MEHVRSRLCGRVLYIKALHWGVRQKSGRPRFNSSLPLLGNLTTLELLTMCNGKLQEVGLDKAQAILQLGHTRAIMNPLSVLRYSFPS